MGNPAGFHVGAVDYRKYLFYQIAIPLPSPGNMSTIKVAASILVLAVMIVGCLFSIPLCHDINQALENLKGMMLETMIICVALNESILNRKRVNRIFEFISKRNGHTRYGFPEEKYLMNMARASSAKAISIYSVFFASNFPLMILTRPVMAVNEGNSWKQLPYPWTIPEDNDLIFYLTLLLQVYGLFISHLLATVGMSTLSTITQITALFDVVIMGIRRMDERVDNKMSQEGLTHHESMLSCLKESIAHHQELVGELLLCKPHLESTFVSLIMNISIIMACEAYPLIKVDLTLSDAIKGVWFLIIQVMCTAIVCNQMEVMSNKNTEVFDALYGTTWYNCNTEYRHIILNGMTFSQNPIYIRGKGLLSMRASRATFYSAMVSTFNMLNMIRKTG